MFDVVWSATLPVAMAAGDLAAWQVGAITSLSTGTVGVVRDLGKRAEAAVIWTSVSWALAIVAALYILLKYGGKFVKEVL